MRLILGFPHRGNPPPDQEGYDREQGDPFVFRLKWPPCLFHGRIDCGMDWCALMNKPIDQNVCGGCDVRTPESS